MKRFWGVPPALLILLSITVASCTGIIVEEVSPTVSKKVVNSITYIRDERVGLCFATVSSLTYAGMRIVSITNVPCEAVGDYLTH